MIFTILITSLLVAAVKLVLLLEVLGAHNVIRFRRVISIIFAVILPILLAGTVTGMMTALVAGIYLSVAMAAMSIFIKPSPVVIDLSPLRKFGGRFRRRTEASADAK